ncbi:hypothetical protein DRE_03217 [Drechslerella stenobrocha 248]|uniref:Peptidase A1 domain-containing protein n=1 Tax=Drechslerella stenobrocha 248 TaxID=1043628 RepID=W7I587_9PEZI|nr:hypothetical protein DRE_03217 [Drechslerella stenobrocha 248]
MAPRTSILLILYHFHKALSLPQAFSSDAFAISTDQSADASHIPAASIAPESQGGVWTSLTAAGSSTPTTADVTATPTSPSPTTSGASIVGDGNDDDGTPTGDSANDFIAAPQETARAGFIPVYPAGGAFVAELNIGDNLLYLRVDTGSFHFWVISNLMPDICTSAIRAGSGCYTQGTSATPLPTATAGYTFRYRDGVKASGSSAVIENVGAAGIFGSVAWASQVVALPATVTPWDGNSGVSGVFPLGFSAQAYQEARAGGSANLTEIIDQSPLGLNNWHFFTTYFKPGAQMFLGFDYDPVELYRGPLAEVSIAAINGSWFVQPDESWSTAAQGSATAAATTDAGSAMPTSTGPAMATGADSDTLADTTATVSATESVETTTTVQRSSSDAPMETTEIMKRQHHPANVVKRQLGSERLPILLDTGSEDTYIDADTVKAIYTALSGSCLTIQGSLHNCTYPCTFDHANFAISPEYPATIQLPWGASAISIDTKQLVAEVYDECEPEKGKKSCSSTCRGSIQAQKSGAAHYVYGAVVYKSAFFKWDTSGNGTVGMAPYSDRGGEPWFYE